jgi:hypothetical protein
VSHFRAANLIHKLLFELASQMPLFLVSMSTPWKNSLAKETLKKDILDGLVTQGMKPKEVIAMRKELYKPFAKNSAANVRSLQRSLQGLHVRSEEDHAWIVHNHHLYPCSDVDSLGGPRWDGSAAQHFLRDDLAAGKLEELGGSKALRNTQPEYLRFSLKVFRERVSQEKSRVRQKSYWMDKSRKKS